MRGTRLKRVGLLEVLSALRLVQPACSTGVGDYVASGLGVNKTSSSPTSSTSPLVTVSLTSGHGNASVDECWSSWERWWSASYLETYGTKIVYETYTTSWTDTISAFSGTTDTYTVIIDTTETIMNGLFPIATDTIDGTYKSTYTELAYPKSTSTGGGVVTLSSLSKKNNTLPTPTCLLPKIVPQCESQWSTWISTQLAPSPTPPPHCDIDAGFLNNRNTVPPCAIAYSSAESSYEAFIAANPSPLCTQASIGGALCESVVQDYVSQGNYQFFPQLATTQFLPFVSAGYLGGPVNESTNNWNITWTWPTSSTMGVPSCTLGCGRCAVTGGTVQLIYWPQTAIANGTNSTVPRTAPAGPVTVETLGTTFTSPTLYISYASVYAANGCSVIGTNITSTIVAIPTNSPLSSVYGGTIPCDAHFRYTQEWTATGPFTVQDLNEPVPYSIYSSQPWCATYLRNNGCQGQCPTTLGYKPILVVPEEVLQDMEPDWATCYGDIRGVYDPPIALQTAASVIGPSMPGVTTTKDSASQSATPASGPAPSTPTQTTGPTTSAPPAAIPDTEGSSSEGIPGPSVNSQSSAHIASPTSAGGGGGTSAGDPGANPVQGAGETTAGSNGKTSVQDSDDPSTQNAEGILASVLGGGVASTAGDLQDSGQASGQNAVSVLSSAGSNEAGSTNGVGASTPDPMQTGAQQSGSSDPGSGDPGASNTVATIGSQVFTVLPGAGSNGAAIVAQGGSSFTVAPGASAVSIGDQQVSAASNGGIVVGAGSEASTVAIGAVQTEGPAVTVGSQTYSVVSQATGSDGAVVVANGQSTATLTAGAQTVLGGQTISAAQSGSVVIGTGSEAHTIVAPSVIPAGASQSQDPAVTVGSQIYSIVSQASGPGGKIVVADGSSTATLTNGEKATLGGQVVSAAQSGGVVVGSGSGATTISNPSATTGEAVQAQNPDVTVDSLTYSIISQISGTNGAIVVADGVSTATLTRGEKTMLGGQVVSEAQSGDIVIGSGTAAATLAGAVAQSASDGKTLSSQSTTGGVSGTSGPLSTASTTSSSSAGSTTISLGLLFSACLLGVLAL